MENETMSILVGGKEHHVDLALFTPVNARGIKHHVDIVLYTSL